MLFLVIIFGLGLIFFSNLAYCDTKFYRPSEIYEKRMEDWIFDLNPQYDVGDDIQISWESSIEDAELWLVQATWPGEYGDNEWSQLDVNRMTWEAEYDVKGLSNNDEDSTYYFAIWSQKMLAQSQYFNVSAPEPEKTHTIIQITTIIREERTTTQAIVDPTTESTTESATESTTELSTTTTATSEEIDAISDSGLSRSQTAGVAVGAVIGGLLILGIVGWFLWRKVSRNVSEGPQVQQQQAQHSELKAELPGDSQPHVSDYARSPTGLYEVP